jgi:hypothetical protein
MRFVGAVLVVVSLTVGYFLGYRGLTFDQMRSRLAQLLNIPGLAPPGVSPEGRVGGIAGQLGGIAQ